MCKMHSFNIELTRNPTQGKILMDGKPISCVQSVKIESSAEASLTITLKILADSIVFNGELDRLEQLDLEKLIEEN